MKEIIGAQGEVVIVKIGGIPANVETKPVPCRADGATIVSHSESGHHHVCTGGEIMERVSGVPAGMKILYAIVKDPEKFVHEAPAAHCGYDLAPGIYEFRIAREHDHFSEQARTVMD